MYNFETDFIICVLKGFGTRFYSEKVSYEGEWHCGKRHGWGRMIYPDCSIYEGEWINDGASGIGMIVYGKSSFPL